MSEINEALVIINTTMKTTADIFESPFKVVGGGAELLQRVLLLMEAARKHHPEKGETMMDDFYKKYGANYTTFTIPDEQKDAIYKELTAAGVEFTWYDSRNDKAETTILIPLQQNRTATEALNRAKLNFIERSAERYASEEVTDDRVREMQENYAAEHGKNFPIGGNEQLQELAVINEYQELASNADYRLITFPREMIEAEKDTAVTLAVSDGTIDIDKKGLIAGQHGSYYGFLNTKTTYWLQRPDGTKKMLVVPEMMDNYFADAATMEENHKKEYFATLREALANMDAEAKQSDDIEVINVIDNKLSINMGSLVTELDEDTYQIRIPKYYADHETGEKAETSYHGLFLLLAKEQCAEHGETIIHEFDPTAEYELYDKDGQVAAKVSGAELYRHNFNVVTHEETRRKSLEAMPEATKKPVINTQEKPVSTPNKKL